MSVKVHYGHIVATKVLIPIGGGSWNILKGILGYYPPPRDEHFLAYQREVCNCYSNCLLIFNKNKTFGKVYVTTKNPKLNGLCQGYNNLFESWK